MFYLPKSKMTSDLEDKDKVQFKVLVDWLRSIHRQNANIMREVRSLSRDYHDSLEKDGYSDDKEIRELDDK